MWLLVFFIITLVLSVTPFGIMFWDSIDDGFMIFMMYVFIMVIILGCMGLF